MELTVLLFDPLESRLTSRGELLRSNSLTSDDDQRVTFSVTECAVASDVHDWLRSNRPDVAVIHCHDYVNDGLRDYEAGLRIYEALRTMRPSSVPDDCIILTHSTYGVGELRERGFPVDRLKVISVLETSSRNWLLTINETLEKAPQFQLADSLPD